MFTMRISTMLSFLGFLIGSISLPTFVEAACPDCPQPGSPICAVKWEGPSPVPTTVTGCYASVVSNWDDGWKTESCNASVPQGSALQNVFRSEISSSNGSYTVSRFTTGSMKYTEQVDEAYKSMYEAAVEYGDKNYAAQIKREWDRHRQLAQTWEGTSDAARLTVTAKGSGNFWDQWRGWETAKVDLQVICIAPANLRDQIEKTLNFDQFAAKSGQYVAIANDTATNLYGLVQPLAQGKMACSEAAGTSSGFTVEKSLQKNFRVNNDDPTVVKNQGMCMVLGRTKPPGYADFSKACLAKTAVLTQLSALPAGCFVN
jgi:hypothetical protein